MATTQTRTFPSLVRALVWFTRRHHLTIERNRPDADPSMLPMPDGGEDRTATAIGADYAAAMRWLDTVIPNDDRDATRQYLRDVAKGQNRKTMPDCLNRIDTPEYLASFMDEMQEPDIIAEWRARAQWPSCNLGRFNGLTRTLAAEAQRRGLDSSPLHTLAETDFSESMAWCLALGSATELVDQLEQPEREDAPPADGDGGWTKEELLDAAPMAAGTFLKILGGAGVTPAPKGYHGHNHRYTRREVEAMIDYLAGDGAKCVQKSTEYAEAWRRLLRSNHKSNTQTGVSALASPQ